MTEMRNRNGYIRKYFNVIIKKIKKEEVKVHGITI